MRNRLIADLKKSVGEGRVPGTSVSILLAGIYELDVTGNEKVDPSVLFEGLRTSLGITLTTGERCAMEIAYDIEQNGLISLKVKRLK